MWRKAKWRIVFPVAMGLDLDQTLLYDSRDYETWAFREKTASIPSSRLYLHNKQAIQLLATGLNNIIANEACKRSVNTTRTTPSIAFPHFKTT